MEKQDYINQYNNIILDMADEFKDIFIIMDLNSQEIVFKNKRAINFNEEFPLIMKYIEKKLSEEKENNSFEILYENLSECDLVYNVNCYKILWNNKPAYAYRIEEIESSKKSEQNLIEALFIDEQTGLYNRRYCLKRINELLANKERFIVSFIDMDNLKDVNENYGYEEGDKYIENLVEIFSDTFRKTDAVCRIGGDEFIIIMPNCPEELAEIRINETRIKINQIKSDYDMSFSYGNILVEKDNTLSREDILKLADKKMYEFKRENRVKK